MRRICSTSCDARAIGLCGGSAGGMLSRLHSDSIVTRRTGAFVYSSCGGGGGGGGCTGGGAAAEFAGPRAGSIWAPKSTGGCIAVAGEYPALAAGMYPCVATGGMTFVTFYPTFATCQTACFRAAFQAVPGSPWYV
ncbi:hypothetical protein KCU93_g196, partial [Aureobasidium melanogenum]